MDPLYASSSTSFVLDCTGGRGGIAILVSARPAAAFPRPSPTPDVGRAPQGVLPVAPSGGAAAAALEERRAEPPGRIATATPARIVAMPRTANGATVSWRNARPSARATIGMIRVLRLTTVASSCLIR